MNCLEGLLHSAKRILGPILVLAMAILILVTGWRGYAGTTDAPAAPGVGSECTVTFPEDHAIGKIFIRNATNQWYDLRYDRWALLCPAQGVVKVPHGAQLRLIVSEGMPADLKPLENLKPDDLRVIDLSRSTADDASLASITKLTGLRALRIEGTKITKEGLAHLKNLSSLKYLSLNDIPLGLDGLAQIEGLSNLEVLEVERCGLSNESLAHITPLKKLKHFRVGGNEITDAGLAFITQLPVLEEARLDCTKLTDAGITQLLAVKTLRKVTFPHLISQEAIDRFKELPNFVMPLPRKSMVVHFVGEDGKTPLACTARIYVATRCDWHYVEEHKIDDSGVIKFNYQVTDTGYFSITTRKPGYANTEVSWSDTTKPDIPVEVTLKLGKGRTIGGQVVNEEGQGIPDVKVEMLSFSSDPDRQEGIPHSSLGEEDFVTTDSGGHWKTDKFPSDFTDVGLRFSHPDYISDEVFNRTPRSPLEDLLAEKAVAVLKRGITVTGTVLNQDGQPIGFARVSQGSDRWGSNYPQIQTDGKGIFEFKNVRPGELILTVQADGYSPELRQTTLSKDMQPFEFRLEPGKTIKGKIVDGDGKPVAGAFVAADTWRGNRSIEWRVDSTADGTFCWTSAPSDEVLFDMGAKDYKSIRRYAMTPSDKEYVITLKKSLKVKGIVVEAESGQPVEGFSISRGILFDGRDTPSWNSIREPNITGNSFEVFFSEPYPRYVIKAEKPGYLPSVSRPFTDAEEEVSLEFRLEKGVGPSGVVKGTDGQPLKGVDLYLITPSNGIYIRNGRVEPHMRETATVKTDDNGHFEFTPQVDPFAVVVVHDLGFAEVSDEVLKSTPEITLKAWGKVEGEVRIGANPAAQEGVSLHYNDPWEEKKPRMTFDYRTNADANGNFVFDRVRPGSARVARQVNLGVNITSYTNGENVDVLPGETARVTIGGYGRPVTGRFVIPATSTEQITFTNYHPSLSSHVPPPFDQKMLMAMPEEQQKEFFEKWRNSEAAKEYEKLSRTRNHFSFAIQADGSFTAQDIPSGTYELSVSIQGPSNDRCGGGDPVARGSKEFSVPEMPGGRSDEPLNLGDLPLEIVKYLKEGAPVPSFSTKTLDDKDLTLESYRGKFVLLYFWSAKCPPCEAELPLLKKVYEEFGANEKFVMMGLNLDPKAEDAKAYVQKEGIQWVQGFLGTSAGQKVLSEYGFRGFPQTLLVDPEGKLVANKLRGEKIATAVREALK